jgi:hypothetical protein
MGNQILRRQLPLPPPPLLAVLTLCLGSTPKVVVLNLQAPRAEYLFVVSEQHLFVVHLLCKKTMFVLLNSAPSMVPESCW